jgi:hypothetical protein
VHRVGRELAGSHYSKCLENPSLLCRPEVAVRRAPTSTFRRKFHGRDQILRRDANVNQLRSPPKSARHDRREFGGLVLHR